MVGSPDQPRIAVLAEDILYGAASTIWLILTAIYVLRGLRRKGAFRTDLKHQVAGPFASFIPLLGILLSAHYSEYFPGLGRWVCVAFIAALAVVAAQLFAHWVTGGVSMQSIHPGYFLPVVAGSFVASIGFSSVHAHDAALAAFGIGAFFWLVVGTVVTVRLMTAEALPPSAKTGLSAYLAAPATASVAWMVSHPGPMGAVQLGLTGVLVMMLLMQVMLIGDYRKLPFSPLFWVFTFPVATTANYAVRWFADQAFLAGKSMPGPSLPSQQHSSSHRGPQHRGSHSRKVGKTREPGCDPRLDPTIRDVPGNTNPSSAALIGMRYDGGQRRTPPRHRAL